MPNRIPVFDDWNRQVGEFIPSGSEGLEGCYALLPFLVILIGGYVFYLTYRFIKDGIQKAKGGDWRKLSIALTIVFIVVGVNLVALVSGIWQSISTTNRHQAEQKYAETLQSRNYCYTSSKIRIGLRVEKFNPDAQWDAMWDQPERQGNPILIADDAKGIVIGGPVCYGGDIEWKIKTDQGQIGWINETWYGNPWWVPSPPK